MFIEENSPCRFCRFYEEDDECNTCYCTEDMKSFGTDEGCYQYEKVFIKENW